MSSHPQTVLLLSRDLGPGGVQRKLAGIAEYLSTLDGASHCRFHLLLQDPAPTDPHTRMQFDCVTASPVKIHHASLSFAASCAWQVCKLHPTVLVAFLRGPSLIAIALKHLIWWRDIKVIVSEDCIPTLALREQVRSDLWARILQRLMKIGYPRADRIVVPSEAARADLVGNGLAPAGKIEINRNWTSLKCGPSGRAQSVAKKAEDTEARGDQIQPVRYDLVYVGRVARVKNLALLLQIINELRIHLPQIRAGIIGGGEDIGAISALRQQLDLLRNLELVGWQSDVSPYLAAARIFCLTSDHEGLPIAALEAMAHGLPVITTAYPGANELVQQGVTGFICCNRSEYVERVRWCLAHDQERADMGQRARDYVKAHHGQANLEEFVRLFMKVDGHDT